MLLVARQALTLIGRGTIAEARAGCITDGLTKAEEQGTVARTTNVDGLPAYTRFIYDAVVGVVDSGTKRVILCRCKCITEISAMPYVLGVTNTQHWLLILDTNISFAIFAGDGERYDGIYAQQTSDQQRLGLHIGCVSNKLVGAL